MIRYDELIKTKEQILQNPEIMDQFSVGRCLIGLTLGRIMGRELTIDDKHDIPALAERHLGLNAEQFERLYFLHSWPEPLRARCHEIPARRDYTHHPAGYISDAAGEQAARALIIADLVDDFGRAEGLLCGALAE